MAIPEGFNEVEHLQDTIRRVANRDVRDWFSDLGGDDWEPDTGSSRASLRLACTHKEGDTIDVTIARMYAFDMAVRQFFRQPVYGIPASSFQESRKFQPQVFLYFLEDLADVDEDYAPVAGEISFRLHGETTETLTEGNARTLANKIKTEFSTGSGYVWRKGKGMFSYSDWNKGYQFQLLMRSETEGRELVGKLLDIQNHTPDWAKANWSANLEPSQAYPTVPARQTIMGRSRRLARKRPIADVRFQYAVLNVHGIVNPIPLVDRSGTFRETLASGD